jgi:uncharacterized zinc-type alcohol dehydrogenase-like protein
MSDSKEVIASSKKFDFIIDTISASHEIDTYLNFLKIDGKLIIVGVPPQPLPVSAFSLIGGRRTFGGSLIGGIK